MRKGKVIHSLNECLHYYAFCLSQRHVFESETPGAGKWRSDLMMHTTCTDLPRIQCELLDIVCFMFQFLIMDLSGQILRS